MEIMELINHPERLDRDTLYELRSVLALNPYFQTARLLMLQNLYLLHDAAFNEELRRAALYITDRKVIFNMIEAAHYQLRSEKTLSSKLKAQSSENRTVDLIDNFLDSIPEDDEPKEKKRRPTPADAAIDYVAYLLETENDADQEDAPQMKGQDLIDTFLEQEKGRITLNDLPEEADDNKEQDEADDNEEEYFTETLARIYIKQGRYQKALDIINRLSVKYPKKNAYFTDQVRFLEKLIINSKKK
jgi:tetratricopeptide (TPR) repeat protein